MSVVEVFKWPRSQNTSTLHYKQRSDYVVSAVSVCETVFLPMQEKHIQSACYTLCYMHI